jgi:uncharacterized membrane protein (DUF485 family)
MEFSKKLTIFLVFFGVVCVIASYVLSFLGLHSNETVTIALITEVVAVQMGYLTYQYGLKSSRDKYGIDKDGVPFENREED